MPKNKIAAISPVNADHVPETAIIKPASEYSSKPHLTPPPSDEAIAQAAGVKQTTAMEADLAAEAAQALVVEIAQV